MLLKIITWLLVAGDGNASSNKCLGYIYKCILSVFWHRSPLLAYLFGDILSALASPSQLWARADLPALAGPKTAQPSSLQLLSWAVSINTYYVPFGVILILFRYLHTLWGCSTKSFTKWLSCCGGKWSCILCFYCCLMLTICSVTYYGPCGVILISFRYLSHSVRMLNKTVYEMVKPLWR